VQTTQRWIRRPEGTNNRMLTEGGNGPIVLGGLQPRAMARGRVAGGRPGQLATPHGSAKRRRQWVTTGTGTVRPQRRAVPAHEEPVLNTESQILRLQ
jgi:hypothetical protein